MDVKILNTSLLLVGAVDKYTYLRYTEDFRDAGELELRLPFDSSIYAILSEQSYLFVEDMLYVVRKLRVQNDELYVYALGFFAELREHYTKVSSVYQMSPSAIILSLVSALKFEDITLKSYGVTDTDRTIEECDACESYYDVIRRIARENDIGIRFSYNPESRELAFRILTIRDRATPSVKELCVISDRRDSYLSLEAITDTTNYKNIADVVYGYDSMGNTLTYTLNRCTPYESPRRILDFPRGLIYTDEESREVATRIYAEKLLAGHAKRDAFVVKALCNSGARVGDLCYFESTQLGRMEYCLVMAKEVCFSDTYRTETLTLEVK